MFFRILGRFIVIVFGFCLALLAATLLLTYLGGQQFAKELASQYGSDIGSDMLDLLGFISFIIELYPAISLLPALLVVVIGEVGRFRSLLFYVLTGGAASLSVPLFYVASQAPETQLPSAQFLAIFATAGFAGGLVYWALAGRKA